MYKIMIKHNPSANKSNTTLWKAHGTTTTTASTVVFKEFETDDLAVLADEVVALDKIYGHENIMVIKSVDVTYGVEIVSDEEDAEIDDITTPTEPDDTDDTTGDDTTDEGDGEDTTMP